LTRSIAAIFDVDGTLFRSPSTERRLVKYLRGRGRFPVTAFLNFLWGALVLSPKGISTVLKGNKYYLRGWSVKDTREVLEEFFGAVIVPLLDNTVADRLRWHQRRGHLIFLLSGMPTFILRQYAGYFGVEHWCGSEVVEKDGRFLGPLENEHPYGEQKGEVVLRFAQENGVDLEASYGYGDHYTDRHFMSLLGHPVAVNPSGEFERLAESRGWKVVRY
jgi:HAD superfamily hydrolase (TIGR01490 family)